MELISRIKNAVNFTVIYHFIYKIKVNIYYKLIPAKIHVKKNYKHVFNKKLNLKDPKTLNEKIQWLKINDRNDFYTICADKYAVRQYIAKTFGEQYLVPLLFETTNYREITPENIPNCNCILKANHDSGHYVIIKDKSKIDYAKLRETCKFWLSLNYYYISKEWQYKNIKPRIIIEKLLQTKEGNIPNDYKLFFFNGRFEFCYVSYDRLGINDRCTYDINWNRLPFIYAPNPTGKKMNYADVPKPASFDKMLEFGTIISQKFKFVRVDFYDVDGKLYFGEITMHHGSGLDPFTPQEYDLIYGEKLNLKG